MCSPAFEFPSAVVSSEWIWFSSFKKMASDTCCFCAGGIIILLGMMVPLGLRVLSSGEGSFVLHSGCLLRAPFSALLLRRGPTPHATSCFLVWRFLSASGYGLVWERHSFAYPVTSMAWPRCTALRNSLSPGASCVLVPSHGLASVLCESLSALV